MGADALAKLASDCQKISDAIDEPPEYVMVSGPEADQIAKLFPASYSRVTPGLLSAQGPSGLLCLEPKSQPVNCYLVALKSEYVTVQSQENIAQLTHIAPAFPYRGTEKTHEIPAQPTYTYCVKAAKPHFICSVVWIKTDPNSNSQNSAKN